MKALRKMGYVERYTYICEKAQTDAGLSNLDRARFHYFNINGIYARQKVLDTEIDFAADNNLCRNGAILAYGGLSYDYFHKRLDTLINKKRVSSVEINVLLEMWSKHIASGYEFLSEFCLGSNINPS